MSQHRETQTHNTHRYTLTGDWDTLEKENYKHANILLLLRFSNIFLNYSSLKVEHIITNKVSTRFLSVNDNLDTLQIWQRATRRRSSHDRMKTLTLWLELCQPPATALPASGYKVKLHQSSVRNFYRMGVIYDQISGQWSEKWSTWRKILHFFCYLKTLDRKCFPLSVSMMNFLTYDLQTAKL